MKILKVRLTQRQFYGDGRPRSRLVTCGRLRTISRCKGFLCILGKTEDRPGGSSSFCALRSQPSIADALRPPNNVLTWRYVNPPDYWDSVGAGMPRRSARVASRRGFGNGGMICRHLMSLRFRGRERVEGELVSRCE
jgi:hypothetical protein